MIRRWVAVAAVAQILGGAILGIASAPFALFSANLVDVAGAGLGAMTGAVLMSGGFLSASVLAARSERTSRGG